MINKCVLIDHDYFLVSWQGVFYDVERMCVFVFEERVVYQRKCFFLNLFFKC